MNNPKIQQKIDEIERLQQRMNRIISIIQTCQYKLKNEIDELMIDDEASSIMDYQWDAKNLKNIDKNLK